MRTNTVRTNQHIYILFCKWQTRVNPFFRAGVGLKVKRLENDVQLLKERTESQEKEMTRLSLEVFGTSMAKEIIPAEEGN